jgi:hypothetical protein
MWGIYEGIGMVLGIAVYIVIFIVALVGALLFIKAKQKPFAWWWVSVMANLFAFLNFLGDSHLIGYMIRLFSILIWPVINIGVFGYLVYRWRKRKTKK